MLGFKVLVFSLAVWQLTTARLDISPPTMFVNKVLELLVDYGDCGVHRVPTCGYYSGKFAVTAKIFHPHNPSNDGLVGITSFAVTTKAPTSCSDVPAAGDLICSVNYLDSPYNPICSGSVPAGAKDLYVRVLGNHHHNINYALTVTFKEKSPTEMFQTSSLPIAENDFPKYGAEHQDDLMPAVNWENTIELGYKEEALIHLKFCPSSATGNNFHVKSIFQADDPDGKSLIAQAICKGTPCTFDTDNSTIALNDNDLPVNIAQSSSGQWTELWVYAVGYGGPLQPNPSAPPAKLPVGQFRFGVTIESN